MSGQIGSVGEVRKKASFEWKISNFSKIFHKSQSSQSVRSSTFKIMIHDQVTEWQLELNPKGITEKFSKFVSLCLQCLSDHVDAYIKVSCAIVNRENSAVCNHFLGYKLFQNRAFIGRCKFVESDFLFNNKKDLLPDDKLIVQCDLFLDKNEVYCKKIENGRVEDFEDFGMLLNNSNLSDVKIMVNNGQRNFYAHKHVLGRKSQVFAAMFEHNMLESRSKSVNITDISPEAVEEMLCFVYTDKIFNIEDSIYLDLIKAADKYQIESLKALCENTILEKLTVESCVEFLAVADINNALKLKDKVIDFIIENSQVLIENPAEFESMTQLHPQVICEIFRKMTLKMGKKD